MKDKRLSKFPSKKEKERHLSKGRKNKLFKRKPIAEEIKDIKKKFSEGNGLLAFIDMGPILFDKELSGNEREELLRLSVKSCLNSSLELGEIYGQELINLANSHESLKAQITHILKEVQESKEYTENEKARAELLLMVLRLE